MACLASVVSERLQRPSGHIARARWSVVYPGAVVRRFHLSPNSSVGVVYRCTSAEVTPYGRRSALGAARSSPAYRARAARAFLLFVLGTVQPPDL